MRGRPSLPVGWTLVAPAANSAKIIRLGDQAHSRSMRLDNPSPWSSVAVAELQLHWHAGLSITAISLKLGVSRDAVAGKARRLHLPPRPSPIRRAPRLGDQP